MQKHIQTKKHQFTFNRNKVLLLVVIIFTIIVTFLLNTQNYEAHLTPIEVRTDSKSSVIKGLGTIKPLSLKLISSPVDATISELHIREGQGVKTGEVLAKLENFELEEQLQNAEYQISVLDSKLNIEKSDLEISRSKLHTELLRAKTAFAQLKLELDANKKLQEQGIVSLINYQKAELSYQQAKLDITAREQELTLFDKSYQHRLASLEVDRSIAAKKLSFLRAQKQRLTITATQDTTVAKVYGHLGNNFRQGAPLFEIIEGREFLAEVQVPQYSANKISTDFTATIHTPNGQLAAKVDYVDTVVRNGASTVILNLVDAAPSWLKPEQSIEAEIQLAHSAQHNQLKYLETPAQFNAQHEWVVYEIRPNGDAHRVSKAIVDSNNPTRVSLPNTFRGNYALLVPADFNQPIIKNVL